MRAASRSVAAFVFLIWPSVAAAQLSDAEAAFQRGLQLERAGSYVDAARMYLRAAQQGHQEAREQFGQVAHKLTFSTEGAEAVAVLRQGAEFGIAVAQHNLAYAYLEGKYVPADPSQAIHWMRRAAEQQDASQLVLGDWYEKGQRGVPQSYTEALKWYRLAADRGNRVAQLSLGWMYKDGNGVTADCSEAVGWFLKSAELGHWLAMNELGRLYETGCGVPKDAFQAYIWYLLSVDYGYPDAKAAADRLEGRLTTTQRLSARIRAAAWKKAHPE